MPSSWRQISNPAYYGLAFALAFVLSVVMLITDKNLQTDFGSLSSGYYFHWYVILATAVADLAGAALLFALRSRSAVKAGVVGSGLLIALFVGVIVTYSQVGFSSATDFADYLFGITYSGGDVRYLYDVLLGVYVATFFWGVGLLVRSYLAARAPRGEREGERSPPPG
jgi:hypothetical protein